MQKRLGALLVFGFLLTACSNSREPNVPKCGERCPGGDAREVARSHLEREPASNVPEAAVQSIVLANNAFAFDLYGQIRNEYEGKNLVFSPLSISLALSMTYAGAQNTTAAEMAGALNLDGPSPHAGQNALSQMLGARAGEALAVATEEAKASGAEPPSADDFRFHIVNSIWGEKSYSWEEPFLDTLAQNYGAGVYLADYRGNPEAERLRINAWVSEETRDKIKDLLPPDIIDTMTRMVLVNALHLKLPWATPFFEAATAKGEFTKADGTEIAADFMSRAAHYRYYEDESVQLVSIPLVGDELSVSVALPKESLSAFVASLDHAAWEGMWEQRRPEYISLKLPKFSFTTDSIELRNAFEALGMRDAFDPNTADFYGMCADPPNGERLFVSEILHKAMMAIDEKGVEAAAATAVVMDVGSAPDPAKPVAMTVDRPFLIAIVDEPTKALVFLGTIDDPAVD